MAEIMKNTGEYIITKELIADFEKYLYIEEKAENTIQKYMHELNQFTDWISGECVSREKILKWKENLCNMGKKASTVNASLAALHAFFKHMGWTDCIVKYLKIQRRVFRETSKELTKEEYYRLVKTAREKGNRRLELLLETICATGIRVSEVQYITVEAAKKGRADICLKGKIRTILIPNKLARKLLKYAKRNKNSSGEIFLTRTGKGISRRQIWGEMKGLCEESGIEPEKVFPHNLRHLFARIFYKSCRDIVRLADVLGHSSVETTRIYLMTTGDEHSRQMELLGLVT